MPLHPGAGTAMQISALALRMTERPKQAHAFAPQRRHSHASPQHLQRMMAEGPTWRKRA